MPTALKKNLDSPILDMLSLEEFNDLMSVKPEAKERLLKRCEGIDTLKTLLDTKIELSNYKQIVNLDKRLNQDDFNDLDKSSKLSKLRRDRIEDAKFHSKTPQFQVNFNKNEIKLSPNEVKEMFDSNPLEINELEDTNE